MNTFFIRWPGFLKKALTLSYDDGVVQDLRLAEIMDKHGIKGTFNINGKDFTEDRPAIFKRERLGRSQALGLYNTPNHEVALHSYAHPFLTRMPAGNAAYEIIKDREVLEEMFGTIVRGMAYPMGAYNENLMTTLHQCGVLYARTIKSTCEFNVPLEWLSWHPTCHHKNPELWNLCDRFLTKDVGYRPLQLFYLWGHSYEFDDHNNWDRIEEFCEKMGGHEEIWYATNLEICEYMLAARSIVASVNGKRLHNPTATVIYLETEKGNVLLQPGETIEI